ncbi:MAG: hypothetical protein ACRDXX_03665 [Stackebrandtia sp.]
MSTVVTASQKIAGAKVKDILNSMKDALDNLDTALDDKARALAGEGGIGGSDSGVLNALAVDVERGNTPTLLPQEPYDLQDVEDTVTDGDGSRLDDVLVPG